MPYKGNVQRTKNIGTPHALTDLLHGYVEDVRVAVDALKIIVKLLAVWTSRWYGTREPAADDGILTRVPRSLV